jgi:hypothetical protein
VNQLNSQLQRLAFRQSRGVRSCEVLLLAKPSTRFHWSNQIKSSGRIKEEARNNPWLLGNHTSCACPLPGQVWHVVRHVLPICLEYLLRFVGEKEKIMSHNFFPPSTMKLIIALLALASASAFTTTSPFVNKAVKLSTRYVTQCYGLTLVV